jgi:dTDP-4-amino-4,6-dideoxygalactose transaminase
MTTDSVPIPFAVPNIDESDVDAVTAVLRSRWLTTGEQAVAFEHELAAYLGAPHVLAVASCTHALGICLAHLDLPVGARVGVPTWTFVSTALAAVHVGLQPVLLDVDEATLNLSPEALHAEVEDLAAVIPVHFGGVAVDDRIFDVCAVAGVPIVEDAAHALGTRDASGRLVDGNRSLAACYSFYATKNLTSGEGGAIATASDELAEFAASQRLHGMSRDAWRRYRPDGGPLYDLIGPGIKANFPDILAALARSQLARFDDLQERRHAISQRYRESLADAVDVEPVPAVFDPHSADHLMVVRLADGVDRGAVMKALDAEGVSTSIHFRPLHQFGWMEKNAIIGTSGLATAEALAGQVLSLPLYPDLTDAQVDRVCAALHRALQRSGG